MCLFHNLAVKAVLDTKPDSGYDEESSSRYHFPSRCLSMLEQCVDDWIIFRRHRADGGDMAYFAVARIKSIRRNENIESHFYANLLDFLRFDTPYPGRRNGRYVEAQLRQLAEQQDAYEVGRRLRGNSVRPLSQRDFSEIVQYGIRETLNPDNTIRLGLELDKIDADTRALLADASNHSERRIEQILLNRKVREANFRRTVCAAYEDTCAFTKLRIINGGGRAEVQAAHILPVQDGGPDIIQNGLALSATAHWLFDRHLVSVSEEYQLLVADNRIPSEFRNLSPEKSDQIHLPLESHLWPSQDYLELHRQKFAG